MKLKTQIWTVGLVGVTAACMVGGIALYTHAGLSTDLNVAIQAGNALKHSQNADMMHDAIRGDVLHAKLGLLEGKADETAAAAKDLSEHVATLNTDIEQLKLEYLPQESRDMLTAAQSKVQAYVATAEVVVKAAAVGEPVGADTYQQFQVAFSELEVGLDQLSDSILKHADDRNVVAQSALRRASVLTGLLLLLALGATVLANFWLARAVTLPMAEAVDSAGRLAQGDLSITIHARGSEETVRLLQALSAMRDGFSRIVRNVMANSESVATASAQIAQGNQDLSQRTEEQASALQQTVATMEQLNTTVRNNADSAKQANQLAQGASAVAAQGGEVVCQVVTTMQGISDSSRKIGDIIGVIDGIAFQTNILALNAAVEAARAGEQGRGFAVVAGEVRTLAQRCAEAAKDIKALIGRSVEQVEQGTALVDQAGRTMGEIVGSIQRVSDIVAEITSASVEQSSGISQVGEAMSQMDQVTQQNAALVEESAAAAESLKSQAQQLVQAVAVFKLSEDSHLGSAFAAPPTAHVPMSKRRAPRRARNVTGPVLKAKAADKPAKETAPAATAAADTVTGTDDWASF